MKNRNNMGLFLVVLILLCNCFVSMPTFADEGGNITGYVKDPSGNAITSYIHSVNLFTDEGDFISYCSTDENGHFSFTGIGNGTYKLSVGRLSQEWEYVDLVEATVSPNTNVDLVFTRKAPIWVTSWNELVNELSSSDTTKSYVINLGADITVENSTNLILGRNPIFIDGQGYSILGGVYSHSGTTGLILKDITIDNSTSSFGPQLHALDFAGTLEFRGNVTLKGRPLDASTGTAGDGLRINSGVQEQYVTLEEGAQVTAVGGAGTGGAYGGKGILRGSFTLKNDSHIGATGGNSDINGGGDGINVYSAKLYEGSSITAQGGNGGDSGGHGFTASSTVTLNGSSSIWGIGGEGISSSGGAGCWAFNNITLNDSSSITGTGGDGRSETAGKGIHVAGMLAMKGSQVHAIGVGGDCLESTTCHSGDGIFVAGLSVPEGAMPSVSAAGGELPAGAMGGHGGSALTIMNLEGACKIRADLAVGSSFDYTKNTPGYIVDNRSALAITINGMEAPEADRYTGNVLFGTMPKINTASLPAVVVGDSYSQTLTAAGGTPPYVWSASGLPTGLSLSPEGVISGTPKSVGTSTVTVTVTDSTASTDNKSFTLAVNGDLQSTWHIRRSCDANKSNNGIAYGKGKFVAVGGVNGEKQDCIKTSTDGVNWTTVWTDSEIYSNNTLLNVAYGDNMFVAVGAAGKVMTSADGTNWTTHSAKNNPVIGAAYDVAYGNGVWVASGVSGRIWVSNDSGVTWKRILVTYNGQPFQYDDLYGITYGNGRFVTVGSRGTILTSADGESWSVVSTENSLANGHLRDVCYANNTFVAVGEANKVYTSSDAATWTAHSAGKFYFLKGVTYGDGKFTAVGDSGAILTSVDGNSWIERPLDSTGWNNIIYLKNIAYGLETGTFIAVGLDDMILQSKAPTASVPTHTVTFNDWDGQILATQTVDHEGAAAEPAHPARGGYTFTGWDIAFNNVTSDLTVTAQYSQNPAPLYTIASISDQTMTALTSGYVSSTQETKIITVIKTGTGDLANLAVALSGTNASSFTITQPTATELNSATTSAAFTVKAKDGLAAGTYTATVTISADNMTNVALMVMQVVNSPSSNSGNNGGGSGGGAPAATPPAGTPKTETSTSGNTATAKTTATATVDGSGKATASVTQEQVSDVVKKAVEEATKQGNGVTAVAEIKVEATADTKTVEAVLPKTAADTVADSNTAALIVSTPIAAITFDSKALDTIAGAATADVKISVAKIDAETLDQDTKQVVEDRPVYNFSVTSGDKTISQFGGNISVSVPYTPKPGEDTNAIVIYYINAQGKPELVSNCSYDPVTATVSFSSNHFSTYAIGYNKVEFGDVPISAWYSDAVDFVAARGITSGTGNNKFSPDNKLTRGQFLVMVMRAYDIKAAAASNDSFTDAGNTYYTGYLGAAKELGITSGVGNNMFAPSKEITRQEMFTLLYNALKVSNRLPQGDTGKPLSAFSDAGQIASWAKDAMTLMTITGTISGSGGKLDPEDTTTRAQMAQVLLNLLSK